jgi:A/G-specific adenine glycosylase
MSRASTAIAPAVIAWQRAHGRHDLPWQGTRDAYAIWVSEIMLQQTQVATVIPYYARFIERFPDVATLAAASLDDVLARWSGLGYYSRARNLHRAARLIGDQHAGTFPQSFDEVAALPGVGRSTAAAIMVFTRGARHAILDGNVKRVLARCYAIAGYPGEKRVADALWREAERSLPVKHIETYTQGLMDLGATVCLRRHPRCEACPLSRACIARRTHRIEAIPAPRPRKPLPRKRTVMVILQHADTVLLEKRPATGVWGGLWCFPELASDEHIAAACRQRFSARIGAIEALPEIEHGFTHFRLTIAPRRLRVSALTPQAAESEHMWMTPADARIAGIPAPVRRLLDVL